VLPKNGDCSEVSASKTNGSLMPSAGEPSRNANDKTKWIFKLRPGVKFHDSSNFDADAA